jgi:CRISPR-associated protein Cas6/Cse3/CasE subtype I-E
MTDNRPAPSVVGEAGVPIRPAPTPVPAARDATPDDDPYAICVRDPTMPRDLWLSRVEFDLRYPQARATLTRDAHARHRIVLRAFPGVTKRQQAAVLHHYTRPTAGRPPRLLVQSIAPPDWSFLAAYATVQVTNIGPFWDQVAAGQRYRFRLTTSPTRAVSDNHGDGRGARTRITDSAQQIGWLARILDGAATLTHVEVSAPARTTAHRHGRVVAVISVTFTGVLTVTEPGRLRQHAVAGIGPYKALGHGLLAIAKEQR